MKKKRTNNSENSRHTGLFKKDALVHINQARAIAGLKPLKEEDYIKQNRVVSRKS